MGRFDTTYDPNSPVEVWKRERGTLNFAMFPDQMQPYQNKNPSCPDCKQKYITLPKEPGIYFCKMCGDKVPIDGAKSEKKLVQKYGARSGGNRPVLASQKAQRKPRKIDSNEVDDEDIKSDLAGFGYNPE